MISFQRIKEAFSLFFSKQLTLWQKITLVKYLIKTKLLSKKIVRSVEVMHTLKCNCHCRFCSNEKLSEDQKIMKKDKVILTLDKLISSGIPAIIFLGGESLVDPNFLDYVKYCKKRNVIPLLQTNGTLLKEEKIKELAKAGLFAVTITMHDTISENHDNTLNFPGASETIKKAIPILKKYGIKIYLKAIFSKDSLKSGSFYRILELAKKENVHLNVNPFMPVGRGVSKENLLSKEERDEYYKVALMESLVTTHTKNEYDMQCPAGHSYFGILPDGEILPCYFLPVSVGNVFDTSIESAIERSAELGIFKKGVDSCVVAMNEKFFDEIISKLYSGEYKLPVRVYEDKKLQGIFEEFIKNYLKQD